MKMNYKLFKNIGFGALTLILIAATWVTVETHRHNEMTDVNPVINFAINHHVSIMIILMLLSIGYGFLWSSITYTEIQRKSKHSKSMAETVMQFLSKEEKAIIAYLVQNKGSASQAEISKLNGMGRVKAFRSLQRMKEKNILRKL